MNNTRINQVIGNTNNSQETSSWYNRTVEVCNKSRIGRALGISIMIVNQISDYIISSPMPREMVYVGYVLCAKALWDDRVYIRKSIESLVMFVVYIKKRAFGSAHESLDYYFGICAFQINEIYGMDDLLNWKKAFLNDLRKHLDQVEPKDLHLYKTNLMKLSEALQNAIDPSKNPNNPNRDLMKGILKKIPSLK